MIIKNIRTGGELERFKQATGAKGRFRLRGPRRNLREHQDASPEVATHGTLYTANAYDSTAYALRGWRGNKPIVRQLSGTSDRSVKYTERRTCKS